MLRLCAIQRGTTKCRHRQLAHRQTDGLLETQWITNLLQHRRNRRSLLQLLAHLQGLYIRQDLWHPNRNFVRHPHSWPHLHHQVLFSLHGQQHLLQRGEAVCSGRVTLRLCHSRCSARLHLATSSWRYSEIMTLSSQPHRQRVSHTKTEACIGTITLREPWDLLRYLLSNLVTPTSITQTLGRLRQHV